MNGFKLRLRTAAFVLILALSSSLALPCSALFRHGHPADSPSGSLPSNYPPAARHQELTTYRNVAVTGTLEAVDPEGEVVSFQLTGHPARGSVSLREDGSGAFVYTPYENKTGRDSFTFVAVDPSGAVSAKARVSIRIIRPDTRVTYLDLSGHPAHKAAIHLAEKEIFVGEQVGGHWFFDPDRPVTRARFLTMAENSVKGKNSTAVMLTGFHDDEAIPVWAKPAVSAALKEGIITGSKTEYGAPVFRPEQVITCGEASVMLNKLLNLPDVPAEVFYPAPGDHWALQAAANLTAAGLFQELVGGASLSQPLTMGDAAQLLDAALTFMDER